jgi:hypothetical protein
MESWEEAQLINRLIAAAQFVGFLAFLAFVVFSGWYFSTHKAVIGGVDHNPKNERFTIDTIGFEPK